MSIIICRAAIGNSLSYENPDTALLPRTEKRPNSWPVSHIIESR